MASTPVQAAPISEAEPTRPVPPRFWWLARGTAAVVLTAAMLLAVRLGWGRAAGARLQAAMAAARGRGEPVTVADFADPPLPADGAADDANAADLFRRAMSGITYTKEQGEWDAGWDPSRPATATDLTMLRAIAAANRGRTSLARRAVDAPAVNWGVVLRRPVAMTRLPLLSAARELANLLRQDDFAAHLAGDEVTAVADLRAIVRLSDAMSTDAPLLVTHLVAIGVADLAANLAVQQAAELHIDPGDPARPAAERLLRQLCDESAHAAGGRRAAFGERLCQLDLADDPTTMVSAALTDGPWPAIWWATRPGIRTAVAKSFTDATTVAAAYAVPTWPAARARVPAAAALPTGTDPPLAAAAAWVLHGTSSGYARAVEVHFRCLTDRRAAAVLLALRLYVGDHGGRLPASLDALVPAYLPAVPVDPMSPDGHVLRWRPERAVLYSVGTDGIDDGGSTAAQPPTVGPVRSVWQMRDAVYPYRRPPTTEPTPGS